MILARAAAGRSSRTAAVDRLRFRRLFDRHHLGPVDLAIRSAQNEPESVAWLLVDEREKLERTCTADRLAVSFDDLITDADALRARGRVRRDPVDRDRLHDRVEDKAAGFRVDVKSVPRFLRRIG